jgi:predicted HTH domain antitoxin
MQITVQLPDDLAQRPDAARAALEAFVIEGYRSGALSHAQAGALLGLSRFEFDGFLKERQIFEHAYDVEDLERDWAVVLKDLEERRRVYTGWLRECQEAAGLSIEPSSDQGHYPFQWKVGSADGRVMGYVIFHGADVAGSREEKRNRLCGLLLDVVTKAGPKASR